jgi:hypothetical protein
MLLAVVATIVPVWAGCLVGGPVHGRGARVTTPTAPIATVRALTVLHGWDRARAVAWSHGDRQALSALYVAGSATGRRDVGELDRWRRRGVRVTGLHQQVARLRVVGAGPAELVVTVRERTVGATAVAGSRRVRLPVSGWASHRVSLRRTAGRWQIVEAVRVGRGGRGP